MNDNCYIIQIVLFNKVQINTKLLQGRKTKLPKSKECKAKGFSCMNLEYIWEHTDQDDREK